MATTTQLRRSLAGLTVLAERDLATVWRQVTTPAQARAALGDVLPDLIADYGLAAGALAADWYDDARDAAEIRGRFQAVLAEPPEDASSLIRWASREAVSLETMPTLVLGGVQRRVVNTARGTVMRSSIADPKARGWMRVGTGRCDFCRMLIGRGAVYTESTVDFHAHDHCGCGAAPAWA
jgi:hypothetical protein